mmetsp:Transcript_19244/g.48166  ORF Transcript_19244/g.48166 Transcript_19244/m.48166 type:complete len:202 (+) Transcript_19244:222-827(+)
MTRAKSRVWLRRAGSWPCHPFRGAWLTTAAFLRDDSAFGWVTHFTAEPGSRSKHARWTGVSAFHRYVHLGFSFQANREIIQKDALSRRAPLNFARAEPLTTPRPPIPADPKSRGTAQPPEATLEPSVESQMQPAENGHWRRPAASPAGPATARRDSDPPLLHPAAVPPPAAMPAPRASRGCCRHRRRRRRRPRRCSSRRTS